MIDVGEETGDLDTMLNKIADNYDEEVEALVESLVSLLEPLMIVVLGGIIGFIVIALFLPLVNLIEQPDQRQGGHQPPSPAPSAEPPAAAPPPGGGPGPFAPDQSRAIPTNTTARASRRKAQPRPAPVRGGRRQANPDGMAGTTATVHAGWFDSRTQESPDPG